jgi:pyruvate kinase
LRDGEEFVITTEKRIGNENTASTSYTDFARDVKADDRVLLADGSVELRVISTDGVAARCLIVSGGIIADRKGINLPGVQVSTPSLTKKDKEDLLFGLDAGVDFVALSSSDVSPPKLPSQTYSPSGSV